MWKLSFRLLLLIALCIGLVMIFLFCKTLVTSYFPVLIGFFAGVLVGLFVRLKRKRQTGDLHG